MPAARPDQAAPRRILREAGADGASPRWVLVGDAGAGRGGAGSRNGVFVNCVRVARARLRDGDTIALAAGGAVPVGGRVRPQAVACAFRFAEDEPPPAAPGQPQRRPRSAGLATHQEGAAAPRRAAPHRPAPPRPAPPFSAPFHESAAASPRGPRAAPPGADGAGTRRHGAARAPPRRPLEPFPRSAGQSGRDVAAQGVLSRELGLVGCGPGGAAPRRAPAVRLAPQDAELSGLAAGSYGGVSRALAEAEDARERARAGLEAQHRAALVGQVAADRARARAARGAEAAEAAEAELAEAHRAVQAERARARKLKEAAAAGIPERHLCMLRRPW